MKRSLLEVCRAGVSSREKIPSPWWQAFVPARLQIGKHRQAGTPAATKFIFSQLLSPAHILKARRECRPEVDATNQCKLILSGFCRCILLIFISFPLHVFAEEVHLSIVRELASMGPRVYGTESSEKAARWIQDQFLSYGIESVKLQPVSGKKHSYNVIATIPGIDPSRKIVIGAHHDSVPRSPGAYDDAGGVSVMLNVARHFTGMQPPYTLLFCSFDGEEFRFAGSLEYVRNLSDAERRSVLFMLDLEMMGWRNGNPNIQTLRYEMGGPNPQILDLPVEGIRTPLSLTSLILDSARKSGISFSLGDPYLSPLYQTVTEIARVRYYGDDISFLLAGIPAVMFTDSSFSAFYPFYHSPQDLPQHVSEQQLSLMSRLIITIIHRTKAGGFDFEITSRRQQAYLFLGPIRLNFLTLIILFCLSLLLLLWTFLRYPGLSRSLRSILSILTETSLTAILFSRYPIFTFFVFGLSAFLYSFCKRISLQNPWCSIMMYSPHLLAFSFISVAALQGYLYGLYLRWPDLGLIILITALSLKRNTDS